MLDYNELYELLRKEKYGDQLQMLSKNFLPEVTEFLQDKRKELANLTDSFSETSLRTKKQFENSLSIFRELMRIRKRKILNLVFVASETGIMKKDFGTMLPYEQNLFERLVGNVEDADKELHFLLNGGSIAKPSQRMILITQPITQFVDMAGNAIGPFDKGMLVNLDNDVASILVSDSKANFVDE